TDGSHVVQVKALDVAGQSTIGTLSIQVLSASGEPFGSLFLVVGALVGSAVALVAFRVWRGRRGPNTKSRGFGDRTRGLAMRTCATEADSFGSSPDSTADHCAQGRYRL